MAQIDTQKDLVLPPGRQVFIFNDKGTVETWVGPARVTQQGSNDTAVVWNPSKRGFDPAVGDPTQAIKPLIQVLKGEYVILSGLPVLKPGKDEPEHPPLGTNSKGPDIDVSKSTVLHGPLSFALWPRQEAVVIPGHRLALDQYLKVAVRDDEQAKASPDPVLLRGDVTADKLTMGATFVIKGTDASFYMPGPGLEVLKDEETKEFVRNAVTAEQLEYVYLKDQGGKKAYVRGPTVVFPRPTQTVVTRQLGDGTTARKFRALELTEMSGLHVKVQAEYVEEAGPDKGKTRKVGEELFLKGKDFPLYYPRVEHMLLRQGDSEIHYAIAVPDGQAYYVRNKQNWTDDDGNKPHLDGEVELIKGPKTLLVDPRYQTLTKRALQLDLVAIMYPGPEGTGNQEALAINQQRLRANAEKAGIDVTPSAAYLVTGGAEAMGGGVRMRSAVAGRQFEGDVATRPVAYAKQHSIDLGSSKYEGAPRMAIDPGYAVLLINSTGGRRVVKDGEVALLEYDEYPRVLRFSTGTPKGGAKRRNDVYLRTKTKISDTIELETSDGVKLSLALSYRVQFQGDETRWFDIEDPVGFMTDNLRSIIHHAVRKMTIREFHKDFAGATRNIVLGAAPAGGERPGKTFDENGLHIYDVDVLNLSFSDKKLEGMFAEAARATFQGGLEVDAERRRLSLQNELTTIALERSKLAAEAAEHLATYGAQKANAEAKGNIAAILADADVHDQRHKVDLAQLEAAGLSVKLEVANIQIKEDQAFANSNRTNSEDIRVLESETMSITARAAAIQPKLIDALERIADTQLIGTIASNFNIQSLVTGAPVADFFSKALRGTRLAGLLSNGRGNGHHADAE